MFTPTTLALWIGLISQVAFLVWGAARISTTLDNLNERLKELVTHVALLVDRVDKHGERIARIEGPKHPYE